MTTTAKIFLITGVSSDFGKALTGYDTLFEPIRTDFAAETGRR